MKAEVERLGGFVGENGDGDEALSVVLERTAVMDDDLGRIALLIRADDRVNRLVLDHTRISDAGLAHREGLTQLTWIYLSDAPVTDAGLEHLRGLTKLRALVLWNTAVTEAGVQRLKQALPKLEGVAFGESRIVPFWVKSRR